MADGSLFADSSPAESGETKAASQEPETQDAGNQTSADEAEKPSESTPDSEPKAESDKDDKQSPPEGDGKSEPKPEKPKLSGAEKRIRQLTARLRAEESARKALEEKISNPPQEEPDLTIPERPKIENFEKWEEYQAADKEWLDKRDKVIAEKAKREAREAEAKTKADEERKRIIAEVEKREAKTIERNPEYNRNDARSAVRPTDTMDSFFVDSKIGPDVLWELYENPDEAERIRALPAWDQARALIDLERNVSERIKGKPAPKKPPPDYVDDRGAAPADEKPPWEKMFK